MRVLPSLLAGVMLTLTAAMVTAAGLPDGLAHDHGNPQGPPLTAIHAHTDGHGHDRDRDSDEPGVSSGPALHGVAEAPPRGLGELHADLDQVAAQVLALVDSDLMPPRNPHRGTVSLDNQEAPSAASTPTNATSTATVTTPFTGGTAAPPRTPARQAPAQASRRFGVAIPSLPGVTLIPPASLPSPATFVPASPARGALPVFLIAAAVALLGGVVGLRLLRRPG